MASKQIEIEFRGKDSGVLSTMQQQAQGADQLKAKLSELQMAAAATPPPKLGRIDKQLLGAEIQMQAVRASAGDEAAKTELLQLKSLQQYTAQSERLLRVMNDEKSTAEQRERAERILLRLKEAQANAAAAGEVRV
jgi:hypothetical protein